MPLELGREIDRAEAKHHIYGRSLWPFALAVDDEAAISTLPGGSHTHGVAMATGRGSDRCMIRHEMKGRAGAHYYT